MHSLRQSRLSAPVNNPQSRARPEAQQDHESGAVLTVLSESLPESVRKRLAPAPQSQRGALALVPHSVCEQAENQSPRGQGGATARKSAQKQQSTAPGGLGACVNSRAAKFERAEEVAPQRLLNLNGFLSWGRESRS